MATTTRARRQLDGNRCTICGSSEDLTADLSERLHGQHRGATVADCRTLCRSCNSGLAGMRKYVMLIASEGDGAGAALNRTSVAVVLCVSALSGVTSGCLHTDPADNTSTHAELIVLQADIARAVNEGPPTSAPDLKTYLMEKSEEFVETLRGSKLSDDEQREYVDETIEHLGADCRSCVDILRDARP